MARAGAPAHRSMITAAVVRTTPLSPHYTRVTIGGAQLAAFEYQGLDQLVRLFFPRPEQTELRMPTAAGNGWMAQTLLMPARTRPYVRNYTVRSFRADELELDIDFVVHGDGPASTWAVNAAPGDPVGLFDEGTMYQPHEAADWQLLVADESAVPAALAIAERTAGTIPTTAYLEVPSVEDIVPVPEGVEVVWLPRTDPHAIPGRLALERARSIDIPLGRSTVFVAGESGLATGLRRQLVGRGIPKPGITFWGYWRHGRASLG